MKLPRPALLLPSWQNALLAAGSAILLILAFPDFYRWYLAWFGLVPLMLAIDREQASTRRSFMFGWLFGIIFFFGTCWWLTFAPITYAGFPPILAYFLLFCVTVVAGLFPAIFAGILSVLLRRFGAWAFLAAPFVWVFTEFLRYWLTGNNWNAIAYSQAFRELWFVPGVWTAAIGGVLLSTGVIVLVNGLLARSLVTIIKAEDKRWSATKVFLEWTVLSILYVAACAAWIAYAKSMPRNSEGRTRHKIIAIQPNVPMTGLDQRALEKFRQQQIDLAEMEIAKAKNSEGDPPVLVILPESPMNFMYTDDLEFQKFIGDFARRNRISVLFNSAEPDVANGKYFNSAVMVGPDGQKIDQYDKIFLLPFGEAVPWPLEGLLPGFVGNFSYGSEYDLFPIGDAKAGVMICFESHFGALSREYVRNGADVIIEMTNDGYLGPTPVLRQHLANAVFRAVETNRPVIRVTNVGITEYISRDGSICDSLITCGPEPFTASSRVWNVSKSDGSQTFYVKHGDWFAWLSSAVTILLMLFATLWSKPPVVESL